MKPAYKNHLWFYIVTTEMIRKSLKGLIYNSTKKKILSNTVNKNVKDRT